MHQGKMISIIFAAFALGILIAPILDGIFLKSLNESHYGLSQENSGDTELPEFVRVEQEEHVNSNTYDAAKMVVGELIYQYGTATGILENLELFPEANTLTAVAYGIMGLSKSYVLFEEAEYQTMLVTLADAHTLTIGFNNTVLGYYRNSQGLYYRDLWGLPVAESEANFWMILALLDAFHATGDETYLDEAYRTLDILNTTHWAGQYNNSYSGYLRRFEVDADGQVLSPTDSWDFNWNWALRDQLLALQCLRKLAYFATPTQYAQIQGTIIKIENLLPLFASNIASFEDADFKPYHSMANNNTAGNLQVDNGSEILGLDQVLLYAHYVGKGIQVALGSAGEKTLQPEVGGREVYAGVPPFPANLALATTFLKNASELRRTIQNFLTLESSELISDAYLISDPFSGTGELDLLSETATNFLYVNILTEHAKFLSNTTFVQSLNLGGRKEELLRTAYRITTTLFNQGIINEEVPLFEGVLDAEGGTFTDPSRLSTSRPAANVWAVIALANIMPIEARFNSYRAIEINTNQTITISIILHTAPSLAWAPSVLGAANYSLRSIATSVDFRLGEEKIPSKYLTIWSLSSRLQNVSFYSAKDEIGLELANVNVDHLGFEFLKIDIPYEVIGQALLAIQEPVGGWEIVEGTKELRIQITAKDSDGSDITGARLVIWYQEKANPGDWKNVTKEPFASPQVVILTAMDKLDAGSHELKFQLFKDGYLPSEFIAVLEVNEPGILDRLRPILESEMTWWAGQILIALGVLWKFNTIVIRRLRGKVTTCSQCGSITSTSYPRCSACGHLWIEEGLQDMKGRVMDAVGDVASEIGLKRGDE